MPNPNVTNPVFFAPPCIICADLISGREFSL